MGVHVKIAGAWQEIGVDGGGSGMPWAKVTGGTVTTYTKPDGSVMEVHTFTAAGTLTVDTPGFAEVLIVGGGSGNWNTVGAGGAGDVISGLRVLPAGAQAVVVGTGRAAAADVINSAGNPSSLGSLVTAIGATAFLGAGGTHANRNLPMTSAITGVSLTYAGGGVSSTSGKGDGTAGTGTNGVVIVAVQKSAPTVSGVVASGGTVTEYTGDGTNGVLGQKYKVHTFTADGTLTVTQGGECDVLIVGGGTGAQQAVFQGGGGGVFEGRAMLGAGAVPVVVGVGGTGGTDYNTPSTYGTQSSIGGVTSGWGRVVMGAGNVGGVASVAGRTSLITGTSDTYAEGGRTTARANHGDGFLVAGPGAAGVVIVRYKVA
jgi:hypothetical protein